MFMPNLKKARLRAESAGFFQRGFTLIELVVVLTIIAILAATALPRYLGLQKEARSAKAQALYGAIRSASVLAHAGCLTNVGGACTPTAGTVDMEGKLVAMRNQYPAANASLDSGVGGIILASNITEATDGVVLGVSGSTLTVDVKGGEPGTCTITYVEAPAGGAPTIDVNTAGC